VTQPPSRRSPRSGRPAAAAGSGPATAPAVERRDREAAARRRILAADHLTDQQEAVTAAERYSGTSGPHGVPAVLYAACRESVDSLHAGPPPAGPPLLAETLRRDAALVARGVAVRAVHPQSALRTPGYARHLRDLAAVGVQVRLIECAPLGLLVFDRRTAVLPGRPDRGGEPPARITGRLVASFAAAYEDCWDRAFGIGTFHGGLDRVVLESRERAVLRLALQGRSDEQIARALDLRRPTVERLITEVMERLGVTTRFELGFRLGRLCVHGDAG
jgi:DNA-binding CsgD family transcriptional regulator